MLLNDIDKKIQSSFSSKNYEERVSKAAESVIQKIDKLLLEEASQIYHPAKLTLVEKQLNSFLIN